ncbi:APC family permease [Dermacoccaceae bacterium W4C1]
MASVATDESTGGSPGEKTALKRGITGTLLFFFILGDTLGAGIYSLMGVMAEDVGGVLWLPLVIALLVALLTAGTYAELITKYPHAGGAARYVDRAFGQPAITFFIGFLMLSSGITTAASLANAFSGDYLQEIISLPAAPVSIALLTILVAINMRGVQESMKANMVMAIIETSGLVIVIVMAALVFGRGDGDTSRLIEFHPDVTPIAGVFGASIIAFFSFLGFEAAANMAEEVQEPSKAYPKALFGAICTAGVVYLLIAVGASIVLDPVKDLAGSTGPLLEVVREAGFAWTDLFSIIALIAVTNGCLLFMVMASRVTYGLAETGLLPSVFGKVLPNRQTPWVAILVVGAITMGMSFLGNVGDLANVTVLLLLLVFIAANISVLVLKKDKVDHDHFSVPKIVPILATIASIGLLTQQDAETWKIGGLYAVAGAILFGVATLGRKAEDSVNTDKLAG